MAGLHLPIVEPSVTFEVEADQGHRQATMSRQLLHRFVLAGSLLAGLLMIGSSARMAFSLPSHTEAPSGSELASFMPSLPGIRANKVNKQELQAHFAPISKTTGASKALLQHHRHSATVLKASSSRRDLLASALFTGSMLLGTFIPGAAIAADETSVGFEEFAAKGGVMKTDPSCFFDQCGDQSKACFANPSCLKGITCLGNCRGEQLCATQCFARFGSEKLNDWLSCTLEDKKCVVTGVEQDTSDFYRDAPTTKAMAEFQSKDLEGKWFKVFGYNPKYDMFPCQINTFTQSADGGLENDILFRVPKPTGAGAWQNNFVEKMTNSKGPQGKASMTVAGKMFGLTFREQWYVLGKGDNWRVVAYKGDTQQGPYDGAFVYAKEKDTFSGAEGAVLRGKVDAVLLEAGLDPKQMAAIDNTCPADATKAGVSAQDASKEKLEWKDVFELTEWFRPGTLKKQSDFNPNKM